jgi:hypothetical protein
MAAPSKVKAAEAIKRRALQGSTPDLLTVDHFLDLPASAYFPKRNAIKSDICSLETAASRPTGIKLRSRDFISLMALR